MLAGHVTVASPMLKVLSHYKYLKATASHPNWYKMVWLLAFLACFGLIHAEVPFNHRVHNERVIGGHNAEPNTWKWQVSLQYDSSYQEAYSHICGGTLIDAFHIMTAAHCILSYDPSHFRVVVGEYNLYEFDGSEQFIRVEQIIVHPGWNGNLGNGNDIALMKLVDPVYDNGFIAIANLPYEGETLPHDFTCHVTGWGLMDYYGTVPDILQEAPIKVVEHAVCSTPEWWGIIALESMVCAGGDGVISGCQGDSGGPLNCLTDGVWRVHGVVSYGPSGYCNQLTKPTVFTKVSSFLGWIYSVTLG
ncbi:chymotrypsin-like elastase family member 2A [Cynoglossus semilaevis]|uniref:Chymotrypsin-like elastase family member 2A n=1 Tax=Cynoglossus semilaevis TaxID=244447 RepID=A0A3P8WTS4_CYNSE|nr:chymotrypsin-like elastase family member 2A [Cynoglossus semilaevis]